LKKSTGIRVWVPGISARSRIFFTLFNKAIYEFLCAEHQS
jgi:hypothetical protein